MTDLRAATPTTTLTSKHRSMPRTVRALVAVLAVAVMSAMGLAVTTGSASAAPGSPKCMTLKEWRQVKANNTMSRAQVKRITGISGRVTSRSFYGDGTRSIDVDYQQCGRGGKPAKGSWNTVWMSFDNYRYDRNYNIVVTGMKVDYKGGWTTPFSF